MAVKTRSRLPRTMTRAPVRRPPRTRPRPRRRSRPPIRLQTRPRPKPPTQRRPRKRRPRRRPPRHKPHVIVVRRRRRRRWPYWVVAPPEEPPSSHPGLERFTPSARRSLRRAGLLRGVWSERLARVDRALVQFINRFYTVDGFDHVVRSYYEGPLPRARVLLLLRFTHQLADRRPDDIDRLRFELANAFAPDGSSIQVVVLRSGARRYYVLPWTRLHPRAIRKLFVHHMVTAARPETVRWVFDGRRLGLNRHEVAREVQRILGRLPRSRTQLPEYRRWRNALERIIVVV